MGFVIKIMIGFWAIFFEVIWDYGQEGEGRFGMKILNGFYTVKIPFSNRQNFPFQTLKIFLIKLSKFPIPNCQNFPFQTVKIFLSKLSKLFILNFIKNSNSQENRYILKSNLQKFQNPEKTNREIFQENQEESRH